MRLGLDHGQLDLTRGDPQIDPGADGSGRNVFGAIKDQLADNLLHPCRAGLGIGRDHDIIVAKADVIPERAVKVVIVQVTGLDRKGAGKRMGMVFHVRFPCYYREGEGRSFLGKVPENGGTEDGMPCDASPGWAVRSGG